MDIEAIKNYNNELREYSKKLSDAKARLEVNRQSIERLCAELSQELGFSVTPDNVEQVYQEQVQKLEGMLRTGMEILGRIKQAEAQGQFQVQAPAQPQNGVQGVQGVYTADTGRPICGMINPMSQFNSAPNLAYTGENRQAQATQAQATQAQGQWCDNAWGVQAVSEQQESVDATQKIDIMDLPKVF